MARSSPRPCVRCPAARHGARRALPLTRAHPVSIGPPGTLECQRPRAWRAASGRALHEPRRGAFLLGYLWPIDRATKPAPADPCGRGCPLYFLCLHEQRSVPVDPKRQAATSHEAVGQDCAAIRAQLKASRCRHARQQPLRREPAGQHAAALFVIHVVTKGKAPNANERVGSHAFRRRRRHASGHRNRKRLP
eukprot:scaffold77944_cov84-Phaeocystis_antarctica.AAC.2